VAAAFVAWDRGHELLGAVESVVESSRPPDSLIVVDNGSKDGSLEELAARWPEAIILRSGRNLGYTGGNNLAIGHALAMNAAYVWLLNDDARVAPGTLAGLLAAAAEHPAAGLLGPLVCRREAPETVLSAGGYLRGGWFATHIGFGEPAAGFAAEVVPVDFLSGCALLASRPFIKRAGLLDESYFMYHEDVDWAYRARAAGFQVLAVRGALAWHPDTGLRDDQSARVTYYIARNSLLFLRKHRLSRWLRLRAALAHLRTLVSWTLRPRWRYRRLQRYALARALWDAARGSTGPAPLG
jgi:GT2 family glycosyltransferase